MKHFFTIAGLTVLLLSAGTTSSALAQSTTNNRIQQNPVSTQRQLTPFELVFMAYQGYFQAQGIPSYQQLILARRLGKISAEDLVNSAIATNRLSPQVTADEGYMSAVENQLDTLSDLQTR